MNPAMRFFLYRDVTNHDAVTVTIMAGHCNHASESVLAQPDKSSSDRMTHFLTEEAFNATSSLN